MRIAFIVEGEKVFLPRILADQDLMTAIEACPELKALVNTILHLCGGATIA